MPALTRWYIQSALVYLSAAPLLALVLALPPAVNLPPFIRSLNSVYFHLFLVRYARLAFLLLNVGIWLVVARATFPAGGRVLLVGRVLEASAVVLLAVHTWKRTVSREGR